MQSIFYIKCTYNAGITNNVTYCKFENSGYPELEGRASVEGMRILTVVSTLMDVDIPGSVPNYTTKF